MFCPKCGEKLVRVEGELTCIPGDMGLSRVLERTLTERYAENAPPQSPEPSFDSKWHGDIQWYCPGCGKPLNNHLECETCGKHLRDLVHVLVEIHPHRTDEGELIQHSQATMSHWNHRVMRYIDHALSSPGKPHIWYAIHEVFYFDDGSISGTQEPSPSRGEDPDELAEYLSLMAEALKHPVLDYETGEEVQKE